MTVSTMILIRNLFLLRILEKLEEEMKKIVKEDLHIERFELPRAEAIKTYGDNR